MVYVILSFCLLGLMCYNAINRDRYLTVVFGGIFVVLTIFCSVLFVPTARVGYEKGIDGAVVERAYVGPGWFFTDPSTFSRIVNIAPDVIEITTVVMDSRGNTQEIKTVASVQLIPDAVPLLVAKGLIVGSSNHLALAEMAPQYGAAIRSATSVAVFDYAAGRTPGHVISDTALLTNMVDTQIKTMFANMTGSRDIVNVLGVDVVGVTETQRNHVVMQ